MEEKAPFKSTPTKFSFKFQRLQFQCRIRVQKQWLLKESEDMFDPLFFEQLIIFFYNSL